MPRNPRYELGEGLYHITVRGNRRQPLFLDGFDNERHLGLLDLAVTTSGITCHGYCQMTNHVHLHLEGSQEQLSYAMWMLNGRYAQAFNVRHGFTGHLFERRFYATRIDGDPHLLEVLRYVPNNPVRSKLVRSPALWRWSSFRALAGFGPAPRFLTTDWTLEFFGRDIAVARRRYREFVVAGIDAPRPSALSRQGRGPGPETWPVRPVAVSLQPKP